MDIDNVKMYAGDMLHKMFEATVPESINGHAIKSDFTVEETFSPHCAGIVIHLHMEFIPNSPAYDGRYDFNYHEAIPVQYLFAENYSGRKAFETDKANVIKDMVNSVIISIIDMDKRFPPEIIRDRIPKYINGHSVYGGYGVNIVTPAYINLDFGFGFEPNSGNTDITHYWSYVEGIPVSGWIDTEEALKLLEKRIQEDIGRRLIDMCEAINKDDHENPIPYSIRRGTSNLINWDQIPDPKPIKYVKENKENVIRTGDGSDESGEAGNET